MVEKVVRSDLINQVGDGAAKVMDAAKQQALAVAEFDGMGKVAGTALNLEGINTLETQLNDFKSTVKRTGEDLEGQIQARLDSFTKAASAGESKIRAKGAESKAPSGSPFPLVGLSGITSADVTPTGGVALGVAIGTPIGIAVSRVLGSSFKSEGRRSRPPKDF